MSRNGDDAECVSFFRQWSAHNARHEERIEQHVKPHLEAGTLPTPDSIREAINSLAGDRRQKFLRYHSFSREHTLREGLRSVVYAAHQACIDVCRHDAALGALAASADFQDKVDFAIGYAVQKDVVAYCALAIGVKDSLKEIRTLRSDIKDQISDIENRVYCEDISAFVRKLRNNLLHGRVAVPLWSVSLGTGNRTSVGSMRYSIEDLTALGHWDEPSRRHMRSSAIDGHLNLSAVVRDHFALLNDLKSRLDALFAKNVSRSEADYWHIEDSHKRNLRRTWAKILVGQAEKGKDPYDYLHRFFEPEAVREILRHPRHSKEQVDFMIGLKSGELDWDNELRRMMYRVFGVADTLSD